MLRAQEQLDIIRKQVDNIDRSGALGRSRSYIKLLEFFVDCWARGHVPRELEIAMAVFGRGADFDPTQDSLVRVYAHNLRQKLESYYASKGAGAPYRLSLSRGEYRIALMPDPEARVEPVAAAAEPPAAAPPAAAPQASPAPREEPPPPHGRTLRTQIALAAAAWVTLGAVLGGVVAAKLRGTPLTAAQVAAQSPTWSSILEDDRPVTVVVGDYYIFGEVGATGNVERLVRDFAVNSSKDLDELVVYNPQFRGKYQDLDLTYLPRGSALAMLDVLRVLNAAETSVRVVSMSEFDVTDVKSNHVVYLGYISGMGMLEDFVFASSSLAVGGTYDELRAKTGDAVYASSAHRIAESRNYRDYGLVSTFPGPGGNQFLVIAGTRDAGLMHAAQILASPAAIRNVEAARPDTGDANPPAFEMLYEVMGYGGTNLDAMLVHTASLDYQKIWGGTYLTPSQ